jgi:alkyldihydroxyacetonephosphate synthase
MIFKDIRAE